MPMRGISQFSTKNLMSNSTGNLRRGTLLCFTKFLDSEKIMDRRGWGEDGRRDGVSRSSVKIFSLTVRKSFVGETFCAVFQKSSGSQSSWISGGGKGVSSFSVEKFSSHNA